MEKYLGWVEFNDGDTLDIVFKDNYLYAGYSTNYTIDEDYKMKYNNDLTLDENLNKFYKFLLKNKESFDENEKLKIVQKQINTKDRQLLFKDSYDEDDELEIYRVCTHLNSLGMSIKPYAHLIKEALEDGDLNKLLPRYISDLKKLVGYLEEDIESLEEIESKL